MRFRSTFERNGRFRFEFKNPGLTHPDARLIIFKNGNDVLTWWDADRELRKAKDIWEAIGSHAGVSNLTASMVPALLYESPSSEAGSWISRLDHLNRLGDDHLEEQYMLRINGWHEATPVILWIDPKTFLLSRIQVLDLCRRSEIHEQRIDYVSQADPPLTDLDFSFTEAGVPKKQ